MAGVAGGGGAAWKGTQDNKEDSEKVDLQPHPGTVGSDSPRTRLRKNAVRVILMKLVPEP